MDQNGCQSEAVVSVVVILLAIKKLKTQEVQVSTLQSSLQFIRKKKSIQKLQSTGLYTKIFILVYILRIVQTHNCCCHRYKRQLKRECARNNASLSQSKLVEMPGEKCKNIVEDQSPINMEISNDFAVQDSVSKEEEIRDHFPTENSVFIENADPVEDVEMRNFPADVIHKKDAETQVNFIEKEGYTQDIFICNKYVNSTCEAETQARRQLFDKKIFFKSIKIIRKKKEGNESLVLQKKKKNSIHRQNYNGTKMGSLTTKKKKKKKIYFHEGFYGYCSIRSTQEMIDLAGVSVDVFNLLLKILRTEKAEDDRHMVKYEDKLLIFLIRMKCGLTLSSISVLFRLHRSTISRIFHSTLNFLSMACKNFVFLAREGGY